MTCADVEALAAELALGTVAGAERAGALDHLAGCAACRELVDQLARAADNLLLLAPVVEPPPGFESKVLARMGAAPARELRRPRRRRLVAGIAAAALVAAMSGAGVAWLTDGDRPADIRTVLIADDKGQWTCRAMVYGDDPTWLVVSLDRVDGSRSSYSVEALHEGNPEPVLLGTFALEGGHGTFARPLEPLAGDLQSVRVLDGGGRVRYTMNFDD